MVSLCFLLTVFPTPCGKLKSYKAIQSRKLKLPIILPLTCDFELSLWFCSRNAEMLHTGSAERLSNTTSCEGAGPPGSWCRDKVIRSHFLTISATGSGCQMVLAPKGAAPTGGQRTLASLYHCFKGQAKNSRKRTTRGYLQPQSNKKNSEAKSGCSLRIFTSH